MANSEDETKPSPVLSPCTGVCEIDEAQKICRGCARSLDEIVRWGQMSEDEKRAVVQRVRFLL